MLEQSLTTMQQKDISHLRHIIFGAQSIDVHCLVQMIETVEAIFILNTSITDTCDMTT